MPYTWTAFLIGSVAIVGLPPLNGFVSEWVVYQALLGSAGVRAARAAIFAVPGLALIGALALACFAKVGGVVFLGQPRSPAAEAVGEVERSMLGPMFALALACAAIGVAPMVAVLPAIQVGASIGGLGGGPAKAAAAAVGPSLLGISLIAVALTLLSGAGWVLRGLVLRRRARAWTDTWGCGYAYPTARMQYTAASFAAPLLTAYGPASGVLVTREAGAFHSHPKDLVLDGLVQPLWERLRRGAFRARPIQHGRLGAYLLYLLGALLLLLLYLAVRVELVRP
jgi:NADH:ubiquinone oxidoreductase subunit 5 (subunit L)/multisubunit Na+/H+ antiporter MnhA subunit